MRTRLLTPVCCLLLVFAAAAEEPPHVAVVFAETGPEIDGRLDDPVWQQAALVDHFTQVTPVQGVPPSERTEVRILTTADSLYFAVRCHDSQIEKAVVNRMRRDDHLFYDDRVQIALDPFHDHQNGYIFEVNPNGARRDVLLEGNAFSFSWDTIWYAKASIDAEGWSAEVRIPYQSLNYDPEGDTWGINFSRGLRRNNEEARWADPYPQRFVADLGHAGVISGMRIERTGKGLDIAPGLTFRHTDDKDGSDFEVEPSGDLFWKALPSLTVSATGNTNFGETEADQREVNFTRFAIAFPEKRDFFLQDALIFEFAEMTDDVTGIPGNAQPFFSRRIGISQPDPGVDLFEPVDILAGGKVTGRLGDVKIGLLHTLVDDVGDVDKQHLTVGRAAMNVFGESTLGVIATHGDPLGQIDNTVVGADFVYRNSYLFGDKNLLGIAWFQRSLTSDGDVNDGSNATIPGTDVDFDGNEHAYSLSLAYPNDRIDWSARYTEIAGSFNPALGFLNRDAIREYDFKYRYRTRRSGYIRTIDHEMKGLLVTNLGDEVESGRLRLQLIELENELAGRIELNYQHTYENPIRDFSLPGGVNVNARGLHWEEGMLRISLTRNRPIWLQLTLGGGQYFDGTRVIVQPELEWRPSKHFLFGLNYDFRQIELNVRPDPIAPNPLIPGDLGKPNRQLGGRATTHVTTARIAFFFTPDVSWTTLVQWDNVSNTLDLNSRLHWIIEDGREIFVVLNQGYTTRTVMNPGITGLQHTTQGLRDRRTQPIIKIGWNFRF